MTKRQAMQKIRAMLRETRSEILRHSERLLASGAINLEEEPNDFRVPKLVLSDALHRAADGWEPFSFTKTDRAMVRNLSGF